MKLTVPGGQKSESYMCTLTKIMCADQDGKQTFLLITLQLLKIHQRANIKEKLVFVPGF